MEMTVGFGLMLVLGVLTVVVCVPASLWVVAVRSRGALGGLVGWWVGVEVGLVRGFGGPFGLPSAVFWLVSVVLGVWWLRVFGVVVVRAWRAGAFEARVWLAARRNIEGF